MKFAWFVQDSHSFTANKEMSVPRPRSLFAIADDFDDGLMPEQPTFSDSDVEEIINGENLTSSPNHQLLQNAKRSPIETDISLSSTSDEDRMNSSTDSLICPSNKRNTRKDEKVNGGSTPPYRKVRSLRLQESPRSPNSILQHSKLSSNDVIKRTKSALFPNRNSSIYDRIHNLNNSFGKSSNLCDKDNPFVKVLFTPAPGKRRRDSGYPDRKSLGASFNESSDKLSDDDLETDIQPSKRIKDLTRYEKEFVEVEKIGSGVFGSVFKCINKLDGCVYAVKKLRKPLRGTFEERRALNEVYAHAQFDQNKYIVRYYSAWAEDNHMLIQNEYCDGGNLAQAIEARFKKKQRFSESEVKNILSQIGRGLRYIHSLDMAHMDIKPGNIFITKYPKGIKKVRSPNKDPNSPNFSSDDGFIEGDMDDKFVYKIGDLGHVVFTKKPEVEEGDCRYMPAELLEDDYAHLPKADIFALGLTIFEVCGGGHLPKNGEEWHSIREGNLPYLSDYSKELNDLLMRMIHRDPKMRPSSAALVRCRILAPYDSKSKQQLSMELKEEKMKNQILSQRLEDATRNRWNRLLGGKVNRSSSVTF